jgi:hypothetical protein
MEVPDGRAPRAGWAPLGNSINRTEDHWIEGEPLSLLTNPQIWRERLRDRQQKPPEQVGLRLRFVMNKLPTDAFEFLKLLSAIAPAFPEDEAWLFLHAEVMDGPEQGLYLAYDNRPPALVTQLHLEKDGVRGHLDIAPHGPLHVNVLFHDRKVDLRSVLVGDVLNKTLEDVASTQALFELGRIHEISLARSTSSESDLSGISIGIEGVRQEHGAQGGFRRIER